MGYTNGDILRISSKLREVLDIHWKMSYEELKYCLLSVFHEWVSVVYGDRHTCRVQLSDANDKGFELVIERTVSEARKKDQLLKGFSFLILRTDLLRAYSGLDSCQIHSVPTYGGIRGRFEIEESFFASCLLLSDSDCEYLSYKSQFALVEWIQAYQIPRTLLSFRMSRWATL